MYSEILYDVTGPMATITLNRPKQLNAWTDRMGAEVKHAVARAEADRDAVAIVITGAGRGFCAGADLNLLRDISKGEGAARQSDEFAAEPGDSSFSESFRGTYTYLMSVRKPVIAAINGPCAGMAVPIALCCDLRFAAESASFMTAFTKRGLVAEWGIGWLLPRLIGTAHAFDLLFSARKVAAPEAERIGLVNRVLPDADLLPHVRAYVENLAASCSPTSMAIMKRQVYEGLNRPLVESEREAFGLMVESFSRPDFKEGVFSFLEKRPPKFPRL